MNYSEYVRFDALGLAELVKKKEVQPKELLEIAIKRLEEVNPKINAVIYKMFEEGLKMAENTDHSGVFAGVPFLIKDLGIHVKGHPLRVGSKGYQNHLVEEDSEITKRLRKAGFVFMGKTNTPEFGLTPYTEPQLFGPTRNPWNLEHSSGGSSGGSASAVSAGIVPIATASDGGGSIRIPASCCGLFGLKPSRGRITLGNRYGDMWSGAVVENCVSRTVRDTAAYLDALQGPGIGELFIIQPPKRPYQEEANQACEKLKIAYSVEHPLGHALDPECIQAVKDTVQLLKDLGHEVVETPLPYVKEALTKVFVAMIVGETSADLEELKVYLGRNVKVGDVELNTWLLGALGKAFTAQEFIVQKRAWNEISRRMGQFLEGYDLLLTPTLSSAPIKVGQLQNTKAENSQLNFIKNFGLIKMAKNNGVVDKLADKSFSYIPYTPIANMTGQPAMSVPLYWSKAGLPIGVQFMARMCEEDVLIRLAAQLEKARPWFDKMPVL